ncbi:MULTISPECIES: hypothetical protein [Pseudomonas]|uniref:Uncharacterized protein n=1 Tax=Pseudomonas entomophila TaxID=312306 RepID=A0A3Q8U4Q1_9PSED|nr:MULTISPECIES: hypothetical protein [Pseudomonas]AZL70628.1 hypothetical protein EJA05_24115 [Pseudomonas oryziphila]MDZ4020079.1 hypothetical protein [Pseudomonas sichuanensis]
MENEVRLLDEYYGFDDGVLKAFEYFFPKDGDCYVRIELYAQNYEVEGDVWRRVDIFVREVSDVRSTVIPTVIHSKIKLLRFNEGWCLEVNGDFGVEPASLSEVKRHSTCYVVGQSVEILEFK